MSTAMTAVVRGGGPWLLLIVTLYVIYRWCERQDRRELSAEERYRERMAQRYWEWEFDVTPLEREDTPA